MTRKEEIEKQMKELRSELNAIEEAERVDFVVPVETLEQLGFKSTRSKDPEEWIRTVGNLKDTVSIYRDSAYIARDVIGEDEYKDIAEAYTTQELIDELKSSENWPKWVTYIATGTFDSTPVTTTFEAWDDEKDYYLIDMAGEALEDLTAKDIRVEKVAQS